MNQENENEIVNLTDSKGNEIPFEIIKVINYENNDYAIMHPLQKFENLDEDACVIFLMKDNGEDTIDLIPEQDDNVLDSVYALYVEWATNDDQGCSGDCRGCSGCN